MRLIPSSILCSCFLCALPSSSFLWFLYCLQIKALCVIALTCCNACFPYDSDTPNKNCKYLMTEENFDWLSFFSSLFPRTTVGCALQFTYFSFHWSHFSPWLKRVTSESSDPRLKGLFIYVEGVCVLDNRFVFFSGGTWYRSLPFKQISKRKCLHCRLPL